MSLRFRFVAADSAGRVRRGALFADTEEQAVSEIKLRGLFPISVRPPRQVFGAPVARRRELAVVFQSLSSLVGVGVPFDQALGATIGLAPARLAPALEIVRQNVRRGQSVAMAFADAPVHLPGAIVGVLRAGEQGSRLGEALEQLADQLEREAELTSKLRSALAYPTLILIMGLGSLLVMGGVVIPRFAVLIQDLGAELPASTAALLAASQWLRRFLGPGLLFAACLFGAAGWHRAVLRPHAHRLLLNTPFLGDVRLRLASARACSTLGGMLVAGVPMMTALEASREAAADAEIGTRIRATAARVQHGERLAASLEKEKALHPVAIQMIRLGENAGQLGPLCRKAGERLASETDRSIKALISLLEPAMILLLGGAIALMAAGLLRAVYSVRPGL